jgi:L-alanine-DL-glutamate epimerase-like enolase superfamily enzyme
VDAFDREYVWQRLWYAQRFFYTGRRVVDSVDNMLWDLASRHAGLPIYKLIGAQRERIPAYRNIGGDSIEELVADAVRAKEEGYKGVKDHSYRGVRGNTDLARALRSALGDDFLLFHDPVESYTCDEAIRIGRELERLGYQWIEEPLQDYDLLGLQKLCSALDLPVLALEWIGAIGGQPFNAAAYLAMGATDIVRQRGVGITGQLKLAHLAEGFGAPIHGGNPHVILAIRHDPIFEMGSIGPCDPPEDPEVLTFQGVPVVQDGYLSIMCGDRPVEEPDWDVVEREAEVII